jgi:hypothetical protein
MGTGFVNKSLRIATAVMAVAIGIAFVPATPATASPFWHHDRGPSDPTSSVNDAPRGNPLDTPRGGIFDDIGNFFKQVFGNPCERIKCCNNPNHSRTIHC